MPLKRTEAADQEEYDADTDVGKDDTHPDFCRQRVHKGEDTGRFVGHLLEHDADAKAHKGLGEINNSLPL